MPDISVIFVEVMILPSRGATASADIDTETMQQPQKLGNNISSSTLVILSHVFKILDRVVARNGGEFLHSVDQGQKSHTLCSFTIFHCNFVCSVQG
jgi:hypothetical protein